MFRRNRNGAILVLAYSNRKFAVLNFRRIAALRSMPTRGVGFAGSLGMSRNGLYALIALLLVAVAGFGIYTYHEQTKPGLEIKVDGNGIKVNGN